ncbi:MAG: hypothetical protein ACM3TN_20485 [Alphaproteobacteria bacterium]
MVQETIRTHYQGLAAADIKPPLIQVRERVACVAAEVEAFGSLGGLSVKKESGAR